MTAMYIALEGPDGVGKSSTAAALRVLLQGRLSTPAYPGTPFVAVRHFPTDVLTLCAERDDSRLTAEDYLKDMENWLGFRPGPVLYPDVPERPSLRDATCIYILDRWVLSTSVYAHIRRETIPPRLDPALEWLARIPLVTFVLMPRRDQTPDLVDPDYPGPAPYNPVQTAEAYRRFMEGALLQGPLDAYVPIAVDRTVDTPQSTAYTIAEWLEGAPNHSAIG